MVKRNETIGSTGIKESGDIRGRGYSGDITLNAANS
jgi:hypothetical protein